MLNVDDVCIVVLCFGDRLDSLRKVLDAACREKPGRILLVENCISDRVRTEISKQIKGKGGLLVRVSSDNNKNLGSAGGYALGIQHAMHTMAQSLYWLLDDDNIPAAGSLNSLMEHWNNSPDNVNLALSSYRQRNPADTQVKQIPVLPRPGSFMRFHLLNLFVKRKPCIAASIPYAAYGGFFIHRKLVEKIKLPDARFFLYQDDLEWSYRINFVGSGRIEKCLGSIITDSEPSWWSSGKYTFISRVVTADRDRIFYDIRNRVFFVRSNFPGNVFYYFINKYFYLFVTLLVCASTLRVGRFFLILKAVSDGEKGRLGKFD